MSNPELQPGDIGIDLAEFVSDFVTMCRECGFKKPSAREVATAYADQVAADEEEYVAVIERMTPQIRYYL